MAMRQCDESEPILRSYRSQSLRSPAMRRAGKNKRHGQLAVTTLCPSHTVHTYYWRKFAGTCIKLEINAAVHESAVGPSRQILRWSLMSAFGVLRTSCQAGHQAHR